MKLDLLATRPDALGLVRFHDHEPPQDDFRAALIAGMSAPAKSIPCRFLYDASGSLLFDRICELPEYYPTRTEIGILGAHAAEMAAAIGPNAQIVELGSGSSAKIGLLLDALDAPRSYVPIDISREHLLGAAQAIQQRYPALQVEAVCADFAQEFDLPANDGGGPRVCFYPGSTIGNLTPPDALAFLTQWAQRLGQGALMIIGVDLRKDAAILEPAYDDAQGVTARFSLNMLARANRELGTDFDVSRFRHRAVYHADTGRVGIDLVSQADQTVHLDHHRFPIAEGEAIHIEDSWKYHIDGFQALAAEAGFTARRVWTDDAQLFSVHLLEVA
ncbi:L-histidine N(alpha)-methyltransferase [Sphingomonas crocodyli]|uniref:L-histidine N(Alpha)-methyltransferase n=1 Tax=Sphingomonas crocodyli TaxID=1979270 RepID=A0A437M8V6_9SPHN|nr:L-histidine N(alpha)-methyltransferase [Sphingomonas crocodyli]RVT94089.1 L-histidine N(alpha)-methyltransferase [Sphingomonas crocodyli]